MRILALAMTLAFTFAMKPALAHGPTPQKVVEKVEIAAPVEKVWALVRDFSAIAAWNPALKSAAGEGGNGLGARRALMFPNGESLTDELDAYDAASYEYSYRLGKDNVKALPASSYSAVLRLTQVGDKTLVEWKSRLYRGDTGNFPADDMNDEAAVKAMQSFFRTGLENLKKTLESNK